MVVNLFLSFIEIFKKVTNTIEFVDEDSIHQTFTTEKERNELFHLALGNFLRQIHQHVDNFQKYDMIMDNMIQRKPNGSQNIRF